MRGALTTPESNLRRLAAMAGVLGFVVDALMNFHSNRRVQVLGLGVLARLSSHGEAPA